MTPMEERLVSVKSVGEEIVGEDELRTVLTSKPNPVVFHAVVPSGRMPISQGILTAMKLNALTSAGCSVKIWIDDCLAETNNELGGDMKKIQKAGHSYLEIWKSFGVNLEKVEFLFASKETELRIEYWEKLMDVATKNFVDDVERSFQVKGQNAEDVLSAAQIIHRSRQCTDILFLKADICLLSMDQRNVGILTRQYCDTTEEKRMPLILSNFMLPELQKVQENMSKNDPPCIYMDDEEAEVNVKIKQAFCPPMIVEENPCLEYVKSIVLPQLNGFEVFRKEENGGNNNYNYGPAGAAIGVNLLSNPELVATDPTISFKTALWFWMTTQLPKPSCHKVITGTWTPTAADTAAGRVAGYGLVTNIINGGLECGIGYDARVADRIGFYKRYCDLLGVSYGNNLDCYNQQSY